MTARWALGLGVSALVLAVVGQNFFGRELNAIFLQAPGIDKVLHFVEYLLAVLAVNSLARRAGHQTSERFAVLVVTVLALVDESLQNLAPGRNVEGFDFAANLAGIALGWVIVKRPGTLLATGTALLALGTGGYTAWDTHARLIDYSRALQYERQHDFVRARDHYLRALKAGMRSPGLFNELSWVEIESGVGDPLKAVEYGSQAYEMQPANTDIMDTYGWALLHAGRTDEALSMLQRAYVGDPDMYCIHYHLGAAYLASGQRERAEYHFRQQLLLPGTREAGFALKALEGLAPDASAAAAK